MWLVKLALGLVAAYAAVIGLMYLAQTWLIFPTGLARGGAPDLPAGAERLEVETPDGHTLAGVHLPPRREAEADGAWLLGFGGNAWNAEVLAAYLQDLFPDRNVAAFHYRGYAPSSGRPSTKAILADAALIHARLIDAGAPRIVAVGLSIGAGPAARLGAERPVAGMLLVTPFDSLTALARDHYPWAPVGPLLRHRMDVAELISGADAPAAVITAEHDTVVPPARSVAVAEAARQLVFERRIAGAGHNDLYGRADFADAMAEALARIAAAAE